MPGTFSAWHRLDVVRVRTTFGRVEVLVHLMLGLLRVAAGVAKEPTLCPGEKPTFFAGCVAVLAVNSLAPASPPLVENPTKHGHPSDG